MLAAASESQAQQRVPVSDIGGGMQAVAQAVAGKIKLPFEVPLKGTRKVSVELACGGALVCLDKCGPDASPGPRKRVRLSGDEWSALVRSFPQMQACIAAQS